MHGRSTSFSIGAVGLAAVLASGCNEQPAAAQTEAPPDAIPVIAVTPAATGGLVLPIACVIGQTCQIQNYVDRDEGPAAADYRCGTRTYEAHGGVDFRLADMRAQQTGVAVLAAADGVVARVRDGVPDVSVTVRGLEAVSEQECGNGVVIDHGEGLSTQSCHMANGSIRVRAGEPVVAGQPIGNVGLSGQSEYPHLHFMVRRGQTVIDPFAPVAAAGTCGAGTSLWGPQAAAALAYRERVVLNAGFTDAAVTMETIEAGTLPVPTATAGALVAYVRALGLKPGDVERLRVTGPGGEVVVDTTGSIVPRPQAQRMIFGGKRNGGRGWSSGLYTATYTIEAEGRTVLEHRFTYVQAGT
jgi:hypothetical protein